MTETRFGLTLSANDIMHRLDLPAVFKAYDKFSPVQRAQVELLMSEGHTGCRSIVHVAGPYAILFKRMEADPCS